MPAINLLILSSFWVLNQILVLAPVAHALENDNLSRLLQAARQEELKGEHDAALDYYEKSTRQALRDYGPNASFVASLYYEMGVIALQSAKFQKAEDFLSEAVRLNPQAVAPRIKLAELLRLRGRPDESLRQAHAALSKHQDSIEARQAVALSYIQLRNPIMSTKAFAQLDAVAHGRRATVLPAPVATVSALPVAPPITLPLPVKLPPAPPKNHKPAETPKKSPPVETKAQPARLPATITPQLPPPPKPKPIKKTTLPAPPPPEYQARPARGGLVPPPPPVVPVYPGFTPPPPPNSSFQLKTEAKVKPKEKPREAPKEEHSNHPPTSNGGDDSDFLLDWAADKGSKKKPN